MLRLPCLSLVALATALLPWTSVRAQIADVPLANANGDFISSRLPGNRTAYPQRQWLVVDRDPAGLNCRDERGQVVALLAYGAVVDSDLKADGTCHGSLDVMVCCQLQIAARLCHVCDNWLPGC